MAKFNDGMKMSSSLLPNVFLSDSFILIYSFKNSAISFSAFDLLELHLGQLCPCNNALGVNSKSPWVLQVTIILSFVPL